MTTAPPRGRRQFLLLAAIFAAPLVAAWLFFAVFPEWQPGHKTNYGELIAPARPLPAMDLLTADGQLRDVSALRGRWSYVYLGAAQCDTVCADKLYQIRQVRTLLNEKRQRVQRVYLAPDAAALEAARSRLAAEHPDLVFLVPAATGASPFEFFGPTPPGTLLLVDPLGNWLMRYPPEAEPKGLHNDIKRLLKASQIG